MGGILDRSVFVPAPRGATRVAPRRRRLRLGVVRALGLLVALSSGAVLAVLMLVPRVAGLDVTTVAPPAAPPAETVTNAVVVATASCLAADPRDTVVVDLAGVRTPVSLESCGTRVGTTLPVRVPAEGGVARTMTAGAPAAAERETSPMTSRLSLVLTLVAALGGGALLVAVGRERLARDAGRRIAPARRAPVRTHTTRSGSRPAGGRRSAQRAAAPGRASARRGHRTAGSARRR